MGMATGVQRDDLMAILQDWVDELAIQTYSDAKLQRMAAVWARRLQGYPFPRVREAAKRLIQDWESDRLPGYRHLQAELRRPPAPGPAAEAYHRWIGEGMHDGAGLTPCPTCGRLPTATGRLFTDCDQDAHARAHVPIAAQRPEHGGYAPDYPRARETPPYPRETPLRGILESVAEADYRIEEPGGRGL